MLENSSEDGGAALPGDLLCSSADTPVSRGGLYLE